jgi:hypothetical protein
MTKTPVSTILKNAFIIYLVATTVNLVIYYIAIGMGFTLKGSQYESFNPIVLYVSSFVFSTLGTIAFLLCRKFFGKNANTTFTTLGLLFIIFFGIPLFSTLKGLELLYFEVSHLVLGLPFIYFMVKGVGGENPKKQ